MALLALGHKLPMMLQYQDKKIFPPDRWKRFQPKELRGSTVGLLGYGSIARELARLLQGSTSRAYIRRRHCIP